MPVTISRIGQARGRPVAQGFGKVRRDHAPLGVGQIGLVSRDGAAMLQSGGRRPHGESKSVKEKPLGITAGVMTQSLFKGCR
jgi:hypothetical protein